LLIARVLRALPKAETVKDGVVHVDQTKSRIRDAALDRFRRSACGVAGGKPYGAGGKGWRVSGLAAMRG
jgi:hypothetical protein